LAYLGGVDSQIEVNIGRRIDLNGSGKCGKKSLAWTTGLGGSIESAFVLAPKIFQPNLPESGVSW